MEAKVIGNSVHFKLFFSLFLLAFGPCFVSCLPIQFWTRSPFRMMILLLAILASQIYVDVENEAKSNTIAAIMCSISTATHEELLLMPLLPTDFSVNAHVHILAQAHMDGCEYMCARGGPRV